MWFEYEPEIRAIGDVLDAEPAVSELAVSTGGTLRFAHVGRVRFLLRGEPHERRHEYRRSEQAPGIGFSTRGLQGGVS